MKPDDLSQLKDDMMAYIAALGLSRFTGFVDEEIPSILWCAPHEVTPVASRRPEDGWKEFLERAKSCGVSLIIFSEQYLPKDELESLEEDLSSVQTIEEEDAKQLQMLHGHVDQLGSLQLAFPYQGVMFLYETTTQWYEDFCLLRDSLNGVADMLLDSNYEEEDD